MVLYRARLSCPRDKRSEGASLIYGRELLPGMLVRLAETGPGEPVRFHVGSLLGRATMKPANRPPDIRRRQQS